MAVTKIIELVGNSTESWEEAARNALAKAAQSLHGITDLEVISWKAIVADGEITQFRTAVKISFTVD